MAILYLWASLPRRQSDQIAAPRILKAQSWSRTPGERPLLAVYGTKSRPPIAVPSATAANRQHSEMEVPVRRCIQNSPIKAKKPTSIRKVTDMIATVRNASLADMGAMGMPPFVGPRFNKFT